MDPKVFVRIGWGKTADGIVLAPPAEQWSPPAAYSKRYGADTGLGSKASPRFGEICS